MKKPQAPDAREELLPDRQRTMRPARVDFIGAVTHPDDARFVTRTRATVRRAVSVNQRDAQPRALQVISGPRPEDPGADYGCVVAFAHVFPRKTPGYASLPACSIHHLRHRSISEMMNTARWKRCVPRAIIATVSDDPNDDHAVEDQFLHIAKDVAMAESITKVLHEEIERIFRDASAVRLAANDAIRRYAGRMSKEELIELQAVLGAKLDELLSAKIGRLVERRSLAWAEQSERDSVTALPNRAAFNRRLRGEIERARRYRRELSVVLFDIDRFKSVNDRFGHPEGDRLLAEVANLLKSSLRQSDAVFRYGGDEFAALCPETSGEAMAHALRRFESNMLIGSRLRGRLAEPLGISWGAASFPADANEEGELIRIADDRLYDRKRSRRRE